MELICIQSSIMVLKRTPAEKMLLARICERASKANDICADSNKELGEAIGMHQQTVSDLISRLHEANLLQVSVDARQANKRQIMPSKELLADYKSIAYSTDSGYKSFTDTAQPDYKSIAYTPIRLCPITGIDISHQKPDCRVATQATIANLFSQNRTRFNELEKKFLNHNQMKEPMRVRCNLMAKAISNRAQKQVRICPISGIDISSQGSNYSFVTTGTLKKLFQSNRHQFDEAATRLGLHLKPNETMVNQCLDVVTRVKLLTSIYHPGDPAAISRKINELNASYVPYQARYCLVTGIDISHQQTLYSVAIIQTLQTLFDHNRSEFDKVASRFLRADQLRESRDVQCLMLSSYIRENLGQIEQQ